MERSRYRIEFLDEAFNQFSRLPKSAKLMIGTALKNRLETEPLKYGKPLRFNLKGYRRIRISIYRVIYQISEKDKLVIIYAVDDRSDVYEI